MEKASELMEGTNETYRKFPSICIFTFFFILNLWNKKADIIVLPMSAQEGIL